MKADESRAGKKIVAIASSTGGPKALQRLIPLLPSNLNAPVMIVQHMPAGFTEALAGRLNMLSPLAVKEAAEGDVLSQGQVFLARGGRHMKAAKSGARHVIRYSDEAPREGVRPCANYMYESLASSCPTMKEILSKTFSPLMVLDRFSTSSTSLPIPLSGRKSM